MKSYAYLIILALIYGCGGPSDYTVKNSDNPFYTDLNESIDYASVTADDIYNYASFTMEAVVSDLEKIKSSEEWKKKQKAEAIKWGRKQKLEQRAWQKKRKQTQNEWKATMTNADKALSENNNDVCKQHIAKADNILNNIPTAGQ